MHEPHYDPEYRGCNTLAEADLPDGNTILILERVNPWHKNRFYIDTFPKNEPAGILDMFNGPLNAKDARQYVRDQWKQHGGHLKNTTLTGIDQAIKDAGRHICMPHDIKEEN